MVTVQKGDFIMWTREMVKSNAKAALSGKYWVAFGVCAIFSILSGLGSIDSTVKDIWNLTSRDLWFGDTFVKAQTPSWMPILQLFSWLFTIFVVYVLSVGVNRYFVHNRFGDTRTNLVFSGFSNGYMNCVGVQFLTNLFIGLWTLLLIVPGVIKLYQYFFVSYILADNPYMNGARARQISRMMTEGEKGAIFTFQLSFLGWYLLGLICFGVGVFFVTPYYQASEAELYVFLRDRAIQSNMLNPAELGLEPQQPVQPPMQNF